MATRRAGEGSVVSAKFRNYIAIISDAAQTDEGKLKVVQELSENFEGIVTSSQYPAFLELSVPRFIAVLRNGEPQFVAESQTQQFRKSLLEIIHRIPANETLRPHVKSILSLMFHLLEIENEENVLVCLRVIIELHKQFRPTFQPEIQQFLQFVKTMYRELAGVMKMQFEGRSSVTVKSEDGGPPLVLAVHEPPAGQTGILKATRSLKVLAELPIIVVLMYQLYKQQIHATVAEFIPIIINTVILSSSSWRASTDQSKEQYIDFVAAQIKTLSFLAYVIRIYQDIVKSYAPTMVSGMLNLLQSCQPEVAHLRKELLIAARHILATDLRNHFIPHIDKLFDEDTLVGTGWTTRESLRPLAYSTLADLVHHVRTQLSLQQLSLAVDLFAKNIHDETLPVSIQMISCKLLLNLVECIRQKSDSDGNGRDILIRMLEVFVQKFETLAKYQIPFIFAKCVRQNADGSLPETEKPSVAAAGLLTPVATTPTVSVTPSGAVRPSVQTPASSSLTLSNSGAASNSLWSSPLSVGDCRGMVKTLVCGVKTITWGAGSCKAPGVHQQKTFFPKEIPIFVRLLKYTLQCLDIYQVTVAANGTMCLRAASCQAVRMREEKENLEHFAGVFTMMNLTAFKEVFNNMIHYLVERIHKNYALQIIPNTFLANPNTSAAFATIMVYFLLSKMEDMGTDVERSNLYLKLFKLVFGSVSLFAQENEHMLKPHLHEIVTKSMELAQSAKEPYNYFLLLRALFRSIGGGSHDLLYQEFLPLLPRLLQGLNRLQSSLHKQHMKDLFVELCLTVPVRLSSLLPYLPMLMDPLVSALNGSQPLISQGLRTLELCVDNLQPDFLYDHIQPVRAELMQALWRQLCNPSDNIAQVAFRVLGKFGGGNRRMLCEPQRLTYKQELSCPSIRLRFPESVKPVTLSIKQVVEQSVTYLKQPSTSFHMRKQSWNIIKAYLVGSLSIAGIDHSLDQFFCSMSVSLDHPAQQDRQHSEATINRMLYQNAIEGLFAAASVKDLQSDAGPFMEQLICYITSCLLVRDHEQQGFIRTALDGTVLIDAIASAMGAEEKDLSRTAEKALNFLTDTAVLILGDIKALCQVPLVAVLVDRLCGNCFERAWYTKAGGCRAMSWMLDKMPLTWLLEHQLKFVSALLFVMMDLTEEVSYGIVTVAKDLLERLLRHCNVPLEGEEAMTEAHSLQVKVFSQVTEHLVRESIALNQTVREQAHLSLKTLSSVTGKTVTEIMEPHRGLLADTIPPKKHLLRHQPVNTQLGLMDGFTFCTTLKPRLFSLDISNQEHHIFYQELLAICELEEAALSQLPCYKNVTSLIQVRKSAMAALAACSYIRDSRKAIFDALRKLLDSDVKAIAVAAEESMKKFLEGHHFEVEQIHTSLRSSLSMLSDYRHLSIPVVEKLSRLMSLFPSSFNEKLCETLLTHFKKWMDAALVAVTSKPLRRNGELPEVKICSGILNMFHLIPAASAKLLEPLISLVLNGERVLTLEIGSPFRDPLFKFVCRHAGPVVDYFISHLAESPANRLFTFLLKRDDAKPLRSVLEQQPDRLVTTAFGTSGTLRNRELQYQGILITRCLVKFNEHWLTKPEQKELVIALRNLWTSDEFQKKNEQPDVHWKEPKYLVKCFLSYIRHHRDDVELLFQLLRVFTSRYMPSFHFLKEFLDQEVAQGYTVVERRQVFFKFVELFHESSFPDEVKAKALQYILIPVFTTSFARGHKEQLLGDPPNPDQDHHDDLVSVFIEKVIDCDRPLAAPDALRIMLLQFSALLVDQASEYVHDPTNKMQKQGSKLRRLTAYAWPCLLNKQCEDPATRYHGHLLLAHIIAKFAINKKIVLQVFHSLLRAHAVEARGVIRQALEVLTPAIPARMDDGNTVLMHWTKKIIVEEGHTVAQLVHILQLVVRHYKVYYPVRGYLFQYMTSFMQKLGFPPNATIEHRRLAVDLAEVIIKWEMQRIKTDHEQQAEATASDAPTPMVTSGRAASPAQMTGVKRAGEELTQDPKRQKTMAGGHIRQVVVAARHVLEKQHQDAVVNFLIRIACQVNEPNLTAGSGSPGELLSRRCVALLKTALRPDVWPVVELKLTWFDKLLSSVSVQTQSNTHEPSPTVNYPNVCTALDILTLLLSVLHRPAVLAMFKPLQRGIVTCMSSQATKVIRGVHTLLAKLMSLFPTESSTASISSKYDELEGLYSNVSRVIFEGLQTYERSTTSGSATTMGLYGTLMILKAACNHNTCYIDRFIGLFMKVLMKMQHDHLSATEEAASSVMIDMMILGFELVKSRLLVMAQEMRKNFISLLVTLIEKSSEIRLLKAVTKIVEEWVKQKSQLPVQQAPSLREKSLLLHRMMTSYEKRFPNEQELNAQFLDLVNYVFRDDSLQGSELTSKLEPAFLAGLRCNQPHVRAKFFEVFDDHLPSQLYERLLYIVQTQNWEFIGPHFWIKQCIELLLAAADCDQPIAADLAPTLLPSVTSVQLLRGAHSLDLGNSILQEGMEVELRASGNQLKLLNARHAKFITSTGMVKASSLVDGIVQLCHEDTRLAFHIWLELFPQLWNLLSEKQQQMLSGEISPFLCSGAHLTQVDCHPSAVEAFLEAFLRCKPMFYLRPSVLKYLGKSHNAWHRACLCLEEHAYDCDDLHPQLQAEAQQEHKQLREGIVTEHRITEEDLFGTRRDETLDCLSELYSVLNEEDMWAGLWHKRCRFQETSRAILLEQHGLFEQAQTAYEEVMGIAREEHNHGPEHPAARPEYRLWREHWIRCCRELGQWNLLTDLGRNRLQPDPYLVLDSSWKIPDWTAMKDALTQVELNSPETLAYKLSLYQGYLAVCHPEEQHFPAVAKLVESASNQVIKQWKRLPAVVSSVHIPILQAAQQIMELQEATQIRTGLQPNSIGRTTSLHDMKAIVKTWRNRLPNPWDDLSHWSNIFMWRQHQYQAIVSAYEQQATGDTNHAMLGVHASAWAIIHLARIARKQDLISVCLDNLNRIHTIPSVPVIDCFHKIRQQAKCYLHTSATLGKGELQEGLDLLESTNLKFFTKDMTAEFFALKGLFYAQMERSEEANKAFSAAIQLNDSILETWGLWGDFLDHLFVKERNVDVGVDAVTCYLNVNRHNDEIKARKFLGRVIWLLNYDDDTFALADVIDKYGAGVPPNHWLPWIPQLLSHLVRRDGRQILNLLCTIGRIFPQSIYFPTRTVYLALKIEHKEKLRNEMSASQSSPPVTSSSQQTPPPLAAGGASGQKSDSIKKAEQYHMTTSKAEAAEPMEVDDNKQSDDAKVARLGMGEPTPSIEGTTPGLTSTSSSRFPFESTGESMASSSDTGPIKATPPMWRCSRIMHRLRELHPTLLSALEAIVDQLVWFRENWVEDILRQLQQALSKCYTIAFERRDEVGDAEVPDDMQAILRKIVSCFEMGFESSSSISATLSSVASETFARRAQATLQDPIFQQLKQQFSSDFDFSSSPSTLHQLIDKLKKWIAILQERVAAQPKSFLLEERCRFLNNFSMSTAEVELPGEFLMPKPTSYFVKIARFLPRVEVVQKYGVSARRLFIRGHNGVAYPYLVIGDNNVTESRREELVFQLCQTLNVCMEKAKDAGRRYLLYFTPRLVSVSPQIRLVEDNPSSVSLDSILEQHCSRIDHTRDSAVTYYYERWLYLRKKGKVLTKELLESLFKEIQSTIIPKSALKKWAVYSYQNAMQYWTFRKQFTLQIAATAFLEYCLHLTSPTPSTVYIARDTGQLLFTGFKFDVTANGELNGKRTVPFRVTPNIAEFIGQIGVAGPLPASIVAAARCAVMPMFNFAGILRTILFDEFFLKNKRRRESSGQSAAVLDDEALIKQVDQAAELIVGRLEALAALEGAESAVDELVSSARSINNLCQMDPAWYPWL